VAQVESFNGATPLGTATAAPYVLNWTNVAAGSYTLTAVATDSLGATAPP
jgi:chitinase